MVLLCALRAECFREALVTNTNVCDFRESMRGNQGLSAPD